MFNMNKKGDELLMENIVFLILNLVIFVMLLVYISNSANGRYAEEQYYAKQIASFIDEASPGMVLQLDMRDLLAKYDKEIKSGKIKIDNILKIDNEKGIVYFSLNFQTYYSYKFFNKVNVTSKINDNYLFLHINEK